MVNGRNSEPVGEQVEAPQTVLNVMNGIDAHVRSGNLEGFRPISTGIGELDAVIGGGFKVGQLALLSGPAGVGKTSLMLQIARNIAASGKAASMFACYEHETDYLAQRLICMESVATGDGSLHDGLRLRDVSDLVNRYGGQAASVGVGGSIGMGGNQTGFVEAVCRDPRGVRAVKRITAYGQNLFLLKGSSYATTIEALSNMIKQVRSSPQSPAFGKPLVLFVDYLQKIATTTPHTDEVARNIEELEGLKELALGHKIVVVAIVAAEVEGLKAQRMRLQHLLASASVAYEADIIMLMNEKFNIVDRRHLEFNRHNAEQYHQYVVLSVEKNRSGSDLVDLELRKLLQYCAFRADAQRVSEALIR